MYRERGDELFSCFVQGRFSSSYRSHHGGKSAILLQVHQESRLDQHQVPSAATDLLLKFGMLVLLIIITLDVCDLTGLLTNA